MTKKVRIKPPAQAAADATAEELQAMREQIAMLQAQVNATAAGLLAIKRDTEAGQVPIDLDGNVMAADNFEVSTAETLGSTVGGIFAALEGMARYVSSPDNHIRVTLDTGTMVLDLPQAIEKTSDVEFRDVTMRHLSGNAAKPTVTIGLGAGTAANGAVVSKIVGNDLMLRVDLTTGSDPAGGGATIFSITPAASFGALPPIVAVIPANRKAWDQQNTANKAVAINLATTTGNKIDLQTGTNALSASSDYSWLFIFSEKVIE